MMTFDLPEWMSDEWKREFTDRMNDELAKIAKPLREKYNASKQAFTRAMSELPGNGTF